MKFIFIRHAESEANKQNILGGFDIPLTEDGMRQAEAAAQNLKVPIEVIFASPYTRTLQTAEAFARKFNLPVKVHDDLREKNYGAFVGKSNDELKAAVAAHPEYKGGEWGGDYAYWGGESGVQVRDRVKRFVDEVKLTYPNKTILAVSHVAIIRTVHRLFSKLEDYHFPIANVSIHEFDL